MLKKWTLNNCGQCWHCKRRDGSVDVDFIVAVKNSPLKEITDCLRPSGESNPVSLPVCKVEDCAMTYVNYNPCKYFEKNEE